jgi:catalase-peroxidase
VPELTTVLVGGLRVLNANADQSKHGVFTKRVDSLTNDFFVNLLDMSTEWKPTSMTQKLSKAATAKPVNGNGPGPAVDLIFGSNSQLRAFAEVYGSSDAQQKFANDFAAAWTKVTNLDRFDLA